MLDRIGSAIKRSEEIDALLASPEVAADPAQLSRLGKERAALAPVVSVWKRLQVAKEDLAEAKDLANDADAEVAALALAEAQLVAAEAASLEEELRHALLPRDPNDSKNVVMEIRGGTGGDEAALFAGDLFRMYQRYAQRRGLRVDVVNVSETEQGGLREIVYRVEGEGAYRLLKGESGVHRVQRVPVTEAQGRVHTSTATVAVLPEADEVDVNIRPEDLRVDIFHSGGPGGQNVNKVATAVRVVHNPTGIVVVSQDERSQLRNKTKAMTVLRSRLYELQLREREAATSAARRSQVGAGERSEKIRTYNFPQDRLTDHRVGLTTHGLQEIMAGQIDQVVAALLEDEQARLLAESGEE